MIYNLIDQISQIFEHFLNVTIDIFLAA